MPLGESCRHAQPLATSDKTGRRISEVAPANSARTGGREPVVITGDPFSRLFTSPRRPDLLPPDQR